MKIGLKTIRALAIMIVMVLTVSAMSVLITGSPAAENASAAAGDYVRVGWLSEIVNWNPLNIEMVEDYVACYLQYSALFTYDQDWNGPVNDLATGYYQVIDEGTGVMTTYINITDNAYFRNLDDVNDDSMPLTSADVVYSFQTMKENTAAFDWYLEEVDNIIATGPYQISMETPYAKATLIDDISALPIVPETYWDANFANPVGTMKPEEGMGSGPFVYEDMVKGSWYKFKTAGNYHGTADYGLERTVDIAGILYTLYTSTDALCQALNAGNEDFIVLTGDVPSFDEVLGAGASVNVYKAAVQEPGICDIAINAIPSSFVQGSYGAHHPALNDPNVRKAIMMTLNKDFIINGTLRGYGLIGSSVVQPGYWQTTIQNQLPYDPVAAKAWLMSHGWGADADSDGYLEAQAGNLYGVLAGTELSGIRCQAPDTDPTYGSITELWQGWAKLGGIGFDSSVESEISMINVAWYKADYDIWVWHWGWGPEPIGGALTCWLTSEIEDGGDNCQSPMGPWWYGWDNYSLAPAEWDLDGPYSAFDQNISDAMMTLDKADRKVICDKLQQWVYDSYCENPPFYDLGLYGYTDAKFDNWGDVAGHSGLSVASDLLWIWFNVKEVTNRAPVFNTVPEDSYLTFVAEEDLEIEIAVSDYEGDPIDVVFDWGDGVVDDPQTITGATSATPVTGTHDYTTAGDYTLTVSITDNYDDPVTGLREPIVRTSVVEVQQDPNDAPVITGLVSIPTSSAYAGDVTTWTVTATDTESWPLGAKVTWDWADGTFNITTPTPSGTQITSQATHVWNSIGTKDVKISVWDLDGLESGGHNVSATRVYTIKVNQPPTEPVIQAINGIPGNSVTCRASSSDVDPDTLKFTWEWDDGTYSVQSITPTPTGATVISSVAHTWDAVGNYSVTVYVDDGNDHNESATIVAVIAEGNVPPGSFELEMTPSPVCVDVLTTFTAGASDANEDVLILTIDFGDDSNNLSATTAGGTAEGQYADFEHTYTAVGTYTVTVWADDGEYNESAPFTVVVPVNVPPVLEMQDLFTAKYNVTTSYKPISVTDEDDDTVTVWFDWGDDTPMTMGNATYAAQHAYMATGSFTMTVYADDGKGHNVTQTATVTVSEANQRAGITIAADKTEITVGESVMFTVTVSDLEGDVVTVEISFGDGETDTAEATPAKSSSVKVFFNYTFESSGEFKVNVTADDGQDHYNTTLKADFETITVDKKGVSTALIVGIGLAIIVAIVVAVMLMKRKKKGGAEGVSGMEGMTMAPEEPPPPQA